MKLRRSLIVAEEIGVLFGRNADRVSLQANGTASHCDLSDFAFEAEYTEQGSPELL
jgi:hypothetical protein